MYSNILSILTQEVKCLLQYGETIDLFDVDLQAHWNAIIQKNLNISDCPHVKKECNWVRAPSFLFMGRLPGADFFQYTYRYHQQGTDGWVPKMVGTGYNSLIIIMNGRQTDHKLVKSSETHRPMIHLHVRPPPRPLV